jgi:hypothetical protein
MLVALGGLVPLKPKLAGSNPAEADGCLRAIRIRTTTFFGGEEKSKGKCHNFYGMLQISVEYDRDTTPPKITDSFPLRYQVSLLVFATGLWKMNQE